MQSWVINGTKKITLHQSESSDINLKTQAKVKVARASLCQSDIGCYENKYNNLPIIPSRSALGFISESSDISLSKGQRVFLSPYTKKGDEVFVNGKDLDGYLSDFSTTSLKNIYVVPESISDEAFTFIEDIALDIKVCEILNIKETEYVLLYGATALNIILAQFCLYYQAIPIIIDSDKDALNIAEEYGIYYTINSKNESAYQRLTEITAGELAKHIIIDTDVFPEIDPDILKFVSNNGKVGLLGYNTALENIKLDISYVVKKRLTIYGFNDGIGEIETAINMLATGIIKVDSLIEKIYDFSKIQDAFMELSSKKSRFKSLVRC